MSTDIRLPQIHGTEKEMLQQIRSYLYQLAPQLQWALEDINKRQESFSTTAPQTSIVQMVGASHGTSNASPQDTFASIKALIIKSADIVNAYYEEITKKLEGDYEAISDYGYFKQHTESKITETSERITASFSNIQSIVTSVSNLDTKLADVDKILASSIDNEVTDLKGKITDAKGELNASLGDVKDSLETISKSLKKITGTIKAGELYKDKNGYSVYGIEVGQSAENENGEVEFKKYARFISDRLSFYDKNDVEVAYISDCNLHITNAEISGSLKLGGFLFDTTNGLAIKWVGRR